MIKIISIAVLMISLLHGTNKGVFKKPLSEDTLLLYALDAQSHQNYQKSSQIFDQLYHQSAKKEYLYHSLRMLEFSNDSKALLKRSVEALNEYTEDQILKRFEIVALLKDGKFAEASQKALILSEITQNASDYQLYADARLKISDYEGAVSALTRSYLILGDDATAERIALIQYAHLGQKTEAMKFLKEHLVSHGDSLIIQKRVASFYADSGELDHAAMLYEQLFDTYGDNVCAEDALRIFLYRQNFDKLTALLERAHTNDLLLLDLYVKAKSFEKASDLAQKLYERENNPLFLAQSAVYKYEAAQDRHNPQLLDNIIENLKKANSDFDDPLFLNYLGYLMIDHDINVSEGMEYVRRALDKQPDSPFYIDSLAWGHYKLNDCVEALRLIKKVESMIGTEEQEVRDHINAIEACKSKEKNK